MGTVLVNYSGKTRKATINGREYIVARATLIVPGVLNGSKGALYYPPEEIAKNFDAWNGIPLTNGHPAVSGNNVSARNPSIIQSHGLGHVYNVNITKNGRLRGEAWFDVKSCERVRPEILNKLKSGEPIELSTGLFTNNVPANNGAHHNGRQYTHVARDYRPDHLAILMDQQGACSLRDGCGVLTDNGRWVTTDDGNHLFLDDKGRTLMTGPSGKEIEGGGKKGKAEKPDRKKTEDQDRVFKSKHDGTEYKSKDDRDSDDRYFDKKIGAAKKAKENENAIRDNLEAVKKAGPTSPRVEALKAAKAKVDAKVAKAKEKVQKLEQSKSSTGKNKGLLGAADEFDSQPGILKDTDPHGKITPASEAKTISDEDWDNAVAGLEKSREAYRQARKSGKKGEAKSRLNDARRFRKTLLGNANTISRQADLLLHNCGGKGGKPGPCPSGKKSKYEKSVDRLKKAGMIGERRPEDYDDTEIRDLESIRSPDEMTLEEYVSLDPKDEAFQRLRHRAVVEDTLSFGGKVSPEVLKDYPDLAKKYGGAVSNSLIGHFATLDIGKNEMHDFDESGVCVKCKGRVGSPKCSSKPINNSHSGDDMATKKEKMVAFLTTNCDCWKGEKDAEILSNFDEDKLKTLIGATKQAIANSAAIHEIKDAFGAEAEGLTVNAMPAFVKGKALAKAPPEEMEDAEEEPAESEMEEVVAPPAKKGKKKMPVVANTSTARSEQPPTLNEWLASAPVEVQEVIRTAQAVEQGAKEKIVKTLVGNSSARTKEDRASLAKFLMAKPLAELNTLSKLSVNRASAPSRDPMAFLEAPAKPAPTVNYAGLGEDFDDDEITGNEDTVLDAPLGCPTANVDWAAEAKLIPTGKRK